MKDEQKYIELVEIENEILSLKSKKENIYRERMSFKSLGVFIFEFVFLFIATAFILAIGLSFIMTGLTGGFNEAHEVIQIFVLFSPLIISSIMCISYSFKAIPKVIKNYKEKDKRSLLLIEIRKIDNQIEELERKLLSKFMKFDLNHYLSDKEISFFTELKETEEKILEKYKKFAESNKSIQNYMFYNKKHKNNNVEIKND